MTKKCRELEQAISTYGLSALAAGIGASPQTLNHWRTRGVPSHGAIAIELFSQGKYVCEKLAQQLHWTRIADEAWPHPEGRPLEDLAIEMRAGPTVERERV